MSDLIALLQGLGDSTHDDLSVAHDALEEIIRLRLENAELREEVALRVNTNIVAERSALNIIKRVQQERDELRAEVAALKARVEKLEKGLHRAGSVLNCMVSDNYHKDEIWQIIEEALR